MLTGQLTETIKTLNLLINCPVNYLPKEVLSDCHQFEGRPTLFPEVNYHTRRKACLKCN